MLQHCEPPLFQQSLLSAKIAFKTRCETTI